MPVIPIVCYRCTSCNRIYEAEPKKCVCERQIYIKGERFGPFEIVKEAEDHQIKVRCILCDTVSTMHFTNIKKQQSCGCKPRHVEVIELNDEVFVYRCRKCNKVSTVRVPVVTYCCEEEDNA
jgi:hypothetical protein